MKLCIVICVFSITGFGTASPLSRYDADLMLYGRNDVPLPVLGTRENKNNGFGLPLNFFNKGSGVSIERGLIGSQGSSGKSSLRQHVGMSSSQEPTTQPSTNLESRDDHKDQTIEIQGNAEENPQDLDLVTRHRLYVHSANTRGNHAEVLPGTNPKLEARGRETRQNKAMNGHQEWNSQSNSVSTSPFDTPKAQAGSSIGPSSLASFGRWSLPNSIDDSGELVNGHLPSEPSQLSRENSFEHITPTVETNAKPKTSRTTKLYRGAGVGVHYIRSNPKEAGLVGLSAFGQAASVGALGPLVYGNKGVGMAVAGVGALSNFLAYSGQAATNVKKWQKTEAKIPKEKQGEPLDPWIDATKAFADRSSQLTGTVSKSAVKPFQIAGGHLKKVVPSRMKKVQSEPSLWREDHKRRSEELEEDEYPQDIDALARGVLPQLESLTLQARNLDAAVSNQDSSAILLRRGTSPGKTGERKDSPPRNPLPSSASTSTQTPREKSPPNRSPPKESSLPSSVSTPATQSRDKSPQKKSPITSVHSASRSEPKTILNPGRSRLPSLSRGDGRRSLDIPTNSWSIPTPRSQSASPPRLGMRRTNSNLASTTQSGSPPSTLGRSRSDSPRPEARAQGRFTVTNHPGPTASEAEPSKGPASPKKSYIGEAQSLKPPLRAPLPANWGPRSSTSPPKRSDIAELVKLNKLFKQDWTATKDSSSTAGPSSGRPSSPKLFTSPPKEADHEEMISPKSAFHEEGFSMPAWTATLRPSGSSSSSLDSPSFTTPPSSPPRQTKSQALAELREQEKLNYPAQADQSTTRTARMAKIPLMSTMRQKSQAPAPLILRKEGSGISSTKSSPFGSPEYQSREPFERPPRDFSRELPRGELPSVAPALPNRIPTP